MYHRTHLRPGLTEDLYICDFEFPDECLNEVPYEDSDPENPMTCGESDESRPEAGYKCVVVKAPMDDDGDFSFVGKVKRPVPVCLDGEGSSDTVPPNVAYDSRRHLLRLGRDSKARRRTSNRSTRTGRSRGTR